jgi:hypothetical protein
LQRRATTLLLHAQRRWPDAINSYLWTNAIRAANDSRNYSPTNEQDTSPTSRFCSISRLPSIQNQHHFGCPTYVLRKELQVRKKVGKWSDRTRVGISLGYSSKHALNVSLILNLQTGLVSPQYHCIYDDLFETTTGNQSRSIPSSQWQYRAGFTMNKPRGEDKDTQDDEQESTSEAEEDYYSSQESQENMDEERNGSDEEDQSERVYISRSGRTSEPPDRLIYDAQACLLNPDDHEDQESWMEQQLLAFNASTDPDTMYYH